LPADTILFSLLLLAYKHVRVFSTAAEESRNIWFILSAAVYGSCNLPDRKSIKKGSVWKVRTQDPENFDEEVMSLVTAWCLVLSSQPGGNEGAVFPLHVGSSKEFCS
jgi:hypothetical protein